MTAMDMLEPGKFGTLVPFKKRYDNFIGGQWVAPVDRQYFEKHHSGDRQGVLRGRTVYRRRC
jgi:hypothetical protein